MATCEKQTKVEIVLRMSEDEAKDVHLVLRSYLESNHSVVDRGWHRVQTVIEHIESALSS